MNKLFSQIELIERLDQLIRLRATGTPKALARKLEISESSLYRLIEMIKEMGAPVKYSVRNQCYFYLGDVDFKCGFYFRELSKREIRKVTGGSIILPYIFKFNRDFFATVRI